MKCFYRREKFSLFPMAAFTFETPFFLFSFLFFSFLFFWDSNLCFFFVCLQSLMHILPHVLNHRSVRFLSSLLENTSFYHHDPQFISLPFLFLNENYIHNLKLFSSFKYDILLITFNIINFYIIKSI